MLFENQQKNTDKKKHNNIIFIVDLKDNTFSCQCDSLDFLQWFVGSPVFDKTRDQYHCKIDDLSVTMFVEAVEVAQKDCVKLRRFLLPILLPVVSLGLLIFFLVVVFKT